MNYRLEQPEALWGFVPLLCLIFYWFWKSKHRPTLFSWRRFWCGTLGFLFALLGLARPQTGSLTGKPEPVAANLILAVDISNSMLAEDITPNRLGFASAFIQQITESMVKPRVALFPFAASGFLQLPLTTDIFALQESLSALEPTATSHQGTDYNELLTGLISTLQQLEQQAQNQLEGWHTPRVLVFSDGEPQTPLDEALLKPFITKKIPIFTIGVGTPEGGTIPVASPFGKREPMKDPQSGRTVITRLDAQPLQAMALQTGGAYFSASYKNIPSLLSQLNQSLALGRRNSQFKVQQELFPFFLALSCFFFFFEFCCGRWQFVIRTLIFILFCGAFNPVFADDDQTRAIEAYNQGLKEMSQGNLNKAAELFEESTLIFQDNSDRKKALYNLGNTFLKMGDPEQALESYQKAFRTEANSKELESTANQRISDNMALAAQVLEQMKKHQQNQPGNEDKEGTSEPGQDPKGPQQFQGEALNESQKKKLYDLIASEEKETLKRIREKNKTPNSSNGKPW